MKILWLAPFPYPSKSTHPAPWIASLARELVNSKGTDITILNYSSGCRKEVETFEYAPGIHVVFVKSPHLLADIATLATIRVHRLRQQMRRLGAFDVIHIHGSEHQYEYCVSKTDRNVVLSVQGILSEYVKYLNPLHDLKKYLTWRIYSGLEQKGFRRVNNFSCRTSWDKSIVRAANPNAAIYTIWEVIREEFHLGAAAVKGRNIYFTGGSNPLKGLDTAIRAFIVFRRRIGGDTRLIVAGNVKKADLDKIKGTVSNPDIFNHIEFTGIIPAARIVAVQREAFCHLHPSLIDNSPNSICESQLMGLPVIAAPTGGIQSLVADGQTGLLATNEAAMAEAMVRLYTDDALWQSISRQSMTVSATRHNKETIVHDTFRMYRQLKNNN